jgi:hypothetical protein
MAALAQMISIAEVTQQARSFGSAPCMETYAATDHQRMTETKVGQSICISPRSFRRYPMYPRGGEI